MKNLKIQIEGAHHIPEFTDPKCPILKQSPKKLLHLTEKIFFGNLGKKCR